MFKSMALKLLPEQVKVSLLSRVAGKAQPLPPTLDGTEATF